MHPASNCHAMHPASNCRDSHGHKRPRFHFPVASCSFAEDFNPKASKHVSSGQFQSSRSLRKMLLPHIMKMVNQFMRRSLKNVMQRSLTSNVMQRSLTSIISDGIRSILVGLPRTTLVLLLMEIGTARPMANLWFR